MGGATATPGHGCLGGVERERERRYVLGLQIKRNRRNIMKKLLRCVI